jgi:hypothetical protein
MRPYSSIAAQTVSVMFSPECGLAMSSRKSMRSSSEKKLNLKNIIKSK